MLPLCLLLCLALVTRTQGAQIAYEGFDYPDGPDISGQNGGTGWATVWSSSPGDTASAGSLSYTDNAGNSLVTSGNRGFYTGGGGRCLSFRDMNVLRGADGTTTWISVLIVRSGPTVAGANPYLRGANIAFFEGDTEHFAIGNASGAPDNFISIAHTGLLANRRPTSTPFDQLSFAVLRIDHLPGNDNAYLFINPRLDAEPAVSSAVAQTVGEFSYAFNRVRPFAGEQDTRPYAEIGLDEIRIGETYADVTPYTQAPDNRMPSILIQPQSRVVTLGENVTLSVAASGTLPLGYQWRFLGTNLAGATGTNYVVANARTNRTGPYVVVVSNSFGMVTSQVANLKVLSVSNSFYEGFETAQALDDWYADNGTWEIGVPTFGPTPGPQGDRAYAGAKCAATVLNGNYTYGQSSRLISRVFTVPPAASNPRLRFWHWYSFAGSSGGGWVQIKQGTSDWVPISPEYAQNGGGIWTRPLIDLTAYAGKQVQLGFFFTAPPASFGGVDAGWYVDEVTIVTGPLTFNNPESWEEGLGDWYADTGTWEVGTPTGGLPSHGTNCAGTVLSGNYTYGQASRLISPAFTVPPAGSNPHLRFWHYYSFAGSTGGGRVQIKEGTNDWVSISPEYAQNGGGVLTRPLIDLTAYAGKQVQLGFYFTAPPAPFGGVDVGWYVDEVTIVTGPLTFNNPENWEEGLGDWYADTGTWEVGTPTGVAPHQGANCAGTVLSGNYTYGQASRLISPAFTVPPAASNPRLRFWHWYSFAGSSGGGRVQIKEGTNDWIPISPEYLQNSGGVWTRPLVNLSAYAGKQVQLGFYFTAPPASFGAVDAGWYVDEVRLLHDFSLLHLGSPVVRTQSTACVQLAIAASSPASTVSYTVHARADQLENLTLNTEGCWTGSITSQTDSQWLIVLQNNCVNTAMGVQPIGSICFTAVSTKSDFVPLTPTNLFVMNHDGSTPPVLPVGSRPVIIADQPLLEAWLGPNRQRMVTTYGKPDTAYEISLAAEVNTNSHWTPGWTNTVPVGLSVTSPVQGALSNAPLLFLRASEK